MQDVDRCRELVADTVALAAAGRDREAYERAALACAAAGGLSWPMRATVVDVALAVRDGDAPRLAAAADLADRALAGACV